jgi:S-adenosyl-L-methionine hydrolase (adenosine-forming)
VADPLVTLTTDFGEDSPYVAAMKGVLLSLNPCARLLDLSHSLPPQDLFHAAFFLSGAVPYFPEGTLHVIVIDPGVGTARAMLYVEIAGQRLLVPDNGVWTLLASEDRQPGRVIQLRDSRYWRPAVSRTFHGRDVLAPVAGHLSLGLDPAALGPGTSDWVSLTLPQPVLGEGRLTGEVVFVDHFGNLLSNLPGEAFDCPVRVTVAGQEARRVYAYGDAPPGTLVAVVSSWCTLEVAVTQGSAAERLRAGVGTPVTVELRPEGWQPP